MLVDFAVALVVMFGLIAFLAATPLTPNMLALPLFLAASAAHLDRRQPVLLGAQCVLSRLHVCAAVPHPDLDVRLARRLLGRPDPRRGFCFRCYALNPMVGVIDGFPLVAARPGRVPGRVGGDLAHSASVVFRWRAGLPAILA